MNAPQLPGFPREELVAGVSQDVDDLEGSLQPPKAGRSVMAGQSWRLRCPRDHTDLCYRDSGAVRCRACSRRLPYAASTYPPEEITDAKTGTTLAELLDRREWS